MGKRLHGWTTWGKTQDEQNVCDSVGSVCQVHLLSLVPSLLQPVPQPQHTISSLFYFTLDQQIQLLTRF